ncbi:MAG TPA: hypothetical protein VM778_14420 [Gemmatimonadota bacterium]|nr:hypothetical protein [Gemmatimonadota bacterium]
MVKLLGAFISILVFPSVGSTQAPVTDTARIAEVLAVELSKTEGEILVEEAGIGPHVAAALNVAVVPKRPRPVCPWLEGTVPDRGVVLVVRLMELNRVRARVHVDTMCSGDAKGPGGFMSIVGYELEKHGGEWRVVVRRTLFIT